MGSEGRWSKVFTGRRLLVGALALGGAVLFCVFAFSKNGVMFDMKVDELLKHWEKFADDERRLRVEGVLVARSLVRLPNCEHRFRLESNGKAIAVRFPAEPADKGCGGVPETFCEHEEGNASVTVQGYVEGTRERPGFVAETIMIKLPRFDLDEPLPRCLPIPLAR